MKRISPRKHKSFSIKLYSCGIILWLIQVILSDGDMSTLANMKLNLELNNLRVETDVLETIREPNKVSPAWDFKFLLRNRIVHGQKEPDNPTISWI